MFRSLLILLLAAPFALAQDTPRPIRLFAEGEDFQVQSGNWKKLPFGENYFASTFAITFLSRMSCLSAPEQIESGKEAVAVQQVTLPAAGEFQVFTRYEQPFNFSVEFSVEIEQNGKAVYRQVFGKLDDPRIWAFNNHQRVPMERYGWGATDNIVWQEKGKTKLEKGPATIKLIASPQLENGKPRVNAAKRNVDLICLTNDTAGIEAQKKTRYLELDGWLVQDGDLFVRLTNPKDASTPIYGLIEPFEQGQHSPYYIHIRDWPRTYVFKSGRLTGPRNYQNAGPRTLSVDPKLLAPEVESSKFFKAEAKNPKAAPTLQVPDEEYLKPGESSGWVPLGPAIDSLNHSQWIPKTVPKNKGEPNYVQIEFAIPDGKGGLKSIKTATVKNEQLEIPGNVRDNPLIRTQLEAVKWLRSEVAKFPKVGTAPKKLPVYGILSFSSAMNDPGPIGEESTKLAIELGSNTLTGESLWAKKMGLPEQRSKLVAHWPVGTVEKNYAAAEKNGTAKSIKIVSYGDEIHISPLTPPKGKEAEFNTKFIDWLKSKKVPGAEGAKFTSTKTDPWFYYSSLYSTDSGIEQYAKETKWLESQSGKEILTGANYSPHSNYMVTELQWVRPFKMRGMTMPWSEDYTWQVPEFSIQIFGYLTSGFRAGAKYHNSPIMMYVMPHSPGNTARTFRLSFYTAMAHGTKMLNYFCASPLAIGNTENYIATDDLSIWKELHKLTHEVGIFEDFILEGKVRPAKVGLLLSSVDEIMTGDNNFKGGIHNQERKAIYYALRHAQVPVDFLTEDDVIDGLANDYRVIYITQQYLHSNSLRALKKWVESGGTVVSLCGGGFLDEFGKPNLEANDFYGVKDQQLVKDEKFPMVFAKQDLPQYTPLDSVKWNSLQVPVMIWQQSLSLGDGKTLATYQNNTPAVIEKTHGKGRVVLCGFFPGMAYLKSGLPIRPVDRTGVDSGFNHFLPTEMNPELRKQLVDAFLPKEFVRPVECSEPLVESTCIDATNKLAVPLMNYTGKPIEKLTVRIAGLSGAKKIRSVERGELRSETKEDATIITLRLDVADMLLIER